MCEGPPDKGAVRRVSPQPLLFRLCLHQALSPGKTHRWLLPIAVLEQGLRPRRLMMPTEGPLGAPPRNLTHGQDRTRGQAGQTLLEVPLPRKARRQVRSVLWG